MASSDKPELIRWAIERSGLPAEKLKKNVSAPGRMAKRKQTTHAQAAGSVRQKNRHAVGVSVPP
jgi:hypothetical protein